MKRTLARSLGIDKTELAEGELYRLKEDVFPARPMAEIIARCEAGVKVRLNGRVERTVKDDWFERQNDILLREARGRIREDSAAGSLPSEFGDIPEEHIHPHDGNGD